MLVASSLARAAVFGRLARRLGLARNPKRRPATISATRSATTLTTTRCTNTRYTLLAMLQLPRMPAFATPIKPKPSPMHLSSTTDNTLTNSGTLTDTFNQNQSPNNNPDKMDPAAYNQTRLLHSSPKLRTNRMIRKMIKEIFGHPNVPAEGEVVMSLGENGNLENVIVALLPQDKPLDVHKLKLSYQTRSIRECECHDMMMYAAARVRIDSSLIPYYPHAFEHLKVNHSLKYWDDGHILFGEFAA